MKQITILCALMAGSLAGWSQVSARLMQHPDVSDTHITFAFGDDIYVVPKSGGVAHRLTSPAGPEMYPRFSPDGKQIAFTANYNGNYDVYVIPVTGGIPQRLTYHGMPDIVQGWAPDGRSVLFTSLRESGKERFSQFYTIAVDGGSPQKLPVPYGEFASYSEDGKMLAYTDRSRVNRNWKRYRGGTAPDIHIFDLASYQTRKITDNAANDELPMWIGDAIYYMSDSGPEKRNNIWKYDINSKTNTQLTKFTDFDITFPSNSSSEIVFEAGGKLYLHSVSSGKTEEVNIQVVTDQRAQLPQIKNVADNLQSVTLSPDGHRVVAEARGELFSLPATEGYIANLTASSGSAERYPAWSPDGRSLAYWSDATGEYQLMVKNLESDAPARKVTNFPAGFYYNIFWSPDSRKVVTINQAMKIMMIDVNSGAITEADEGKYMFEGGLRSFSVSWSPDSRYFTYSLSKENRATSAVYLYDTRTAKASKITSGFYSDSGPVFSTDGKYVFFTTNRTFRPVYSDLDNTFIYPNTTGIAVGTVSKSVPSVIALKNDEFKKEEEKKPEDTGSKKNKLKEEPEPMKEKIQPVNFDTEGFENRIEMLEIEHGNIGNLATINGKLLYLRYPNAGSPSESKSSLEMYNYEDRESKTVLKGVQNYIPSADKMKLLVRVDGKLAVVTAAPDQKLEKIVPVKGMAMTVVPKEEWKQIFNDVWRFERDYFYDPNMHGVDWNLMRNRYGELIEQANSRNDVNLILGDLIAELDASHTYVGGGDTESATTMNVGYIGADLALENGAYRIKNIVEGAEWDVEARSPLQKPGVEINEGDYILAVNGKVIETQKPFYAALQGLANEVVQLTVNNRPTISNARKILVKPLSSESRLRHLAWAHQFRKRVDEATNSRIGYVFVPSTGQDGQNELVRQFYGQMNKEGFIIDERFNNGGQIPDRFVELLDRKPLAFWAVRDGEDWQWPPSGNFGPKVMLINGFAGSGGDAFPDYFRKRGIGPLIGTRTWGGLIGISGAPSLIDGGRVTVPTFRMYDPAGTWFKEGHGVEPDIKVEEDFESLAKGTDVQLEAAIREVMRLLESEERFITPERPAYEKRN